jgi:HEPN domain-containing protein
MKDKLEVFISSKQEEFWRIRTALANKINKMPFLSCKLLENRGAESTSTIEASLQGARDCDIYIGIFGTEYSEITAREYREAFEQIKICLNYVKTVKKEKRLAEFLKTEVKTQFKYHPFNQLKDLQKQVEDDLNRHLLILLRLGIEKFKMEKKKAIKTYRKEQKEVRVAIRGKDENKPLSMLNEAQVAYRNNYYLNSVITSAIAVELALKLALLRKDLPQKEIQKSSLGRLLALTLKTELLSSQDTTKVKGLQYVRNAAIHDGRAPTRKETEEAIEIAEILVKKLIS